MKIIDKIIKDTEKNHKGEYEAKKLIILCCMGRLVKNKKPYSFNVFIYSASASGKDYIIKNIIRYFDSNDVETYARTSKTALEYAHTKEREPDYSYDGKIIYLPEVSDESLNNEILKNLTSIEQKEYKVAITTSKKTGNEINFSTIVGHPSVFCTSAKVFPDDEVQTRFNIITLNTSEEQTKATFFQQNDIEANNEIREELKTFQSYNVEIPKKLFKKIREIFPFDKVRYRRDFQRFIDFIKACAIINQKDRKIINNTLIATKQDYNFAIDIFRNTLSCPDKLPLDTTDKDIIQAVKFSKDAVSVGTIKESLGENSISIQKLYPRVQKLRDMKVLKETEAKNIHGDNVRVYSVIQEQDKNPFDLPKI